MNTSGAWKYFKKLDAGDKVQCLIINCGNKLAYSGNNIATTNFIYLFIYVRLLTCL
jgi:hypothetical protein